MTGNPSFRRAIVLLSILTSSSVIAQKQGCTSPEIEADGSDVAALLQTARQVAVQRYTPASLPKAASATASEYDLPFACTGNSVLDLLAYDSRLSFMHHQELVRAAANGSHSPGCNHSKGHSLAAKGSAVLVPIMSDQEKSSESMKTVATISIYLALCVLLCTYFLGTVVFPGDSKARLEESAKTRPEQVCWDRSYFSWLMMSWVDVWMGHWGNALSPHETKIEPQALGQHGWKEDQSLPLGKEFGKLWKVQMAKSPTGKPQVTDLLWVVIHFASYRRLFVMGVSVATYESLMYLGPALCVRSIILELGIAHARYEQDPGYGLHLEALFGPTLHVITLYSVGVVFMIFAETVMFLMVTRINTKLRSALSSHCFHKAQLLPGQAVEFELPGDSRQGLESTRYSFVALINQDINANLQQMFISGFQIIFMIPVLVALFLLMTKCIGKGLIFMMITQFVLIALIILVIILQTGQQKAGGNMAGERVTLCQEIFQGIRLIKSYAWEGPAEEMLNEVRSKELKHLHRFFAWMGCFFAMVLNYTRIVQLVTLVGYVWCYGDMDGLTIFTYIQLMRSFNGAMMVVVGIIPQLIGVVPSLKRIVAFLALEESAKSVHLEDEARHDTPLDASVVARLKGSFAWGESDPVALHDVDFQVRKGELVGIVGAVGSGKTALITALLGELHSCPEAEQNAPDLIAYHSQVPLIVEGSLRENILFWRDYEPARYQTVLHGASLLRDLDYLPGNDLCAIGHRGIALSGGQRVRVSLARLAYTEKTELMLIDDPFGAVDMPTGDHILKHLLQGKLLEKRARVVVCQPDVNRLRRFDRVVVMHEGHIVANAPFHEIEHLEAFRSLLKESEADGETSMLERTIGPEPEKTSKTESKQVEDARLRDEEHEGRATWETLNFFFSMGGWHNWILCFFTFGAWNLCQMGGDVVMTLWGDASMQDIHTPTVFLMGITFWTLIGFFIYYWNWWSGMRFSLFISDEICDHIIPRLMCAPIDGFYDKNPVGRIVNRLSADLGAIDYTFFVKICQTLGLIWQFFLPIIYVHCCFPWYFTLATLPFYWFIFFMLGRYLNLMVPLRYLASVSRSKLSSYVDEVGVTRSTVRAYNVTENVTANQAEAVDDLIKTDFAAQVAKKWMVIRCMMLFSMFLTLVTLISLWFPTFMSVSRTSLCVSYIVAILMTIDNNLDAASALQFECISLNRLHEYTTIIQEKAQILPSDSHFSCFFEKVQRSDLGKLQVIKHGDARLTVVRDGKVLLKECDDGDSFQLGPDATWSELCITTSKQLEEADPAHRLVGVDSNFGSMASSRSSKEPGEKIAAMAQSICFADKVTLNFQSNWLADGARVVVKDLTTGYLGFPNTLHGVNLDLEARSKVAIIGSSGCGKSTLFLCFLRLIEPRSGSITINGVDTSTLGLRTLRRALGLVPQDPILLSGSLRYNLDPFGEHSDERLWRSLCAVELGIDVYRFILPGTPRDCPDIDADSPIEKGSIKDHCLSFQIKPDGENLSVGQRQLLCIARMILRQPALLLLDECTSAIDPRTQELVQNSIRKEFPKSTLISIAHRLETIMDFDSVLVMDRGLAVKQGKPSNFSTVLELVKWAKAEDMQGLPVPSVRILTPPPVPPICGIPRIPGSGFIDDPGISPQANDSVSPDSENTSDLATPLISPRQRSTTSTTSEEKGEQAKEEV